MSPEVSAILPTIWTPWSSSFSLRPSPEPKITVLYFCCESPEPVVK